jgi:single-stranded DNA-specific DHH superfamily exonuclease
MTKLSKRLDESARLLPEKPFLNIDSEVCLEECSMQLIDFLDACQPFGRGNREPVWKLSRLFVMAETRAVGNNHLKIHFRDQKGTEGEGIFFNAGHIDPASIHGKLIDLAVTLRKGDYLDKIYPEIRVLDVRQYE